MVQVKRQAPPSLRKMKVERKQAGSHGCSSRIRRFHDVRISVCRSSSGVTLMARMLDEPHGRDRRRRRSAQVESSAGPLQPWSGGAGRSWSTIAEAACGGTPVVLVVRPSASLGNRCRSGRGCMATIPCRTANCYLPGRKGCQWLAKSYGHTRRRAPRSTRRAFRAGRTFSCPACSGSIRRPASWLGQRFRS